MAKKSDKTILLVAVDFSIFSKQALVYAGELAEKLEAQLLVLHVIHDPAEAPGFYAKRSNKKKFLKSMEEAAEEMMEEFLLELRQSYPDQTSIQKATSLLVVGSPVTRIVEVAEKKKVDMIIIGSHGRTGLADLLLGSKVQRVVQLATIPVTVVKSRQQK